MGVFKRLAKLQEHALDAEDSWEEEDDASTTDESDEELRVAFATGKLKPGLNYVVEKRGTPANNQERLLQKLKEIRLDLPWIERFDITNTLAPLAPEVAAEIGVDPSLVLKKKPTNKKRKADEVEAEEEEGLDNVDDDFKRELRFYRQAQGAVLEAIPRLRALGIPTKRPADYFAEMAKSDEHMKNIRSKLLERKQQMEASEKAKKLREQKKYGKQVQQEVLKKRQEEKKKFLESVKNFRKSGKTQDGELDFLTEAGDGEKPKKPKAVPGKGKPIIKGIPRKTGKQKYKDTKYGFGGQKKRSKYNTKESNDNIDGAFSKSKHGSGARPGKGKGKQQSKRPGKIARKNMGNKKR